jgi:hypothetical protein
LAYAVASVHSWSDARCNLNATSACSATGATKPYASLAATIRRDGERLIVEPVKRRQDLATLLAGWQSLDEPFPDVDEGLLPLDDIRL